MLAVDLPRSRPVVANLPVRNHPVRRERDRVYHWHHGVSSARHQVLNGSFKNRQNGGLKAKSGGPMRGIATRNRFGWQEKTPTTNGVFCPKKTAVSHCGNGRIFIPFSYSLPH